MTTRYAKLFGGQQDGHEEVLLSTPNKVMWFPDFAGRRRLDEYHKASKVPGVEEMESLRPLPYVMEGRGEATPDGDLIFRFQFCEEMMLYHGEGSAQ